VPLSSAVREKTMIRARRTPALAARVLLAMMGVLFAGDPGATAVAPAETPQVASVAITAADGEAEDEAVVADAQRVRPPATSPATARHRCGGLTRPTCARSRGPPVPSGFAEDPGAGRDGPSVVGAPIQA